MQELQRRGIPYNFIDSGQHAQLTAKLIKVFALKKPDVYLRDSTQDITSLFTAIGWSLKWFAKGLWPRQQVFQQLFKGKKGVCLVHGDTLSTLLSLLLAKRVGIKIAHIEAGLRSFNLMHPFPEELIRLTTMRFADILFTPSAWAYNNLLALKVKGDKVNLGGNSIVDAIKYALQLKPNLAPPSEDYIIVTTHRFETLYSRRRLATIIDTLRRLAAGIKVLFVLHKPTRKQLQRFGLYQQLDTHPQIELRPMQEYVDFIHLIKNARFIITDGGSIQEESYYLNIPCLVMRKKTERKEGLNANVYLAEFDQKRIDYFINHYNEFRNNSPPVTISPSEMIVNSLQEKGYI